MGASKRELRLSLSRTRDIFACVTRARCGVVFTPPSLTRDSLLPVSETFGKSLIRAQYCSQVGVYSRGSGGRYRTNSFFHG